MLTPGELRIFAAFARKPFAELTRTDIKKATGQRSNNAVAKGIAAMKQDALVQERRIGRSGLLSLDLQSRRTHAYLALCNEERVEALARQCVTRLRTEVVAETEFYSLALFGSYASGEVRPDSDLDVAIIIQGSSQKQRVEAAARNAALRSPLELDIHILTEEEMLAMLTAREENLGKEIARNHIAMENGRILYGLLLEGMRRGFRP